MISRVLLGFHSVGMIDGVIGLVTELSQPSFPLQEVGLIPPGSQPQPSNPMVDLSGIAGTLLKLSRGWS